MTISDTDLDSRLRQLAAQHLDIAADRLLDSALLGEDLGVDSLAAIELGMVVEDEFAVSLPDEVLSEVWTFGDLLRVVAERLPRR